MAGWTKLFASIVTSSVWCEPHATVRVWVAMLATADADGVVEGSLPGFANLARVSIDEMRAAVATLSGPDPDSRTPDHEGRRIEVLAGGWRILNYAQYRERGQAKEGSRAPYMRSYRASLRDGVTRNGKVLRVTQKKEERGEKRENVQRTIPAPDGASSAGADRGAVDRVFAAWRSATGKATAKFTTARRDLIRRRLREHGEPTLLSAIAGNKASPFHQGDNDRNRKYDSLELILRNAEKIEGFAELARASSPPAESAATEERWERGKQFLREHPAAAAAVAGKR